jgi:hypothetical protein
VTNSSFLRQPVLYLLPNLPLLFCHLLLLSIIPYNTGLVERVLLALLKLFLAQLYPLVLAQPRMLDLDLRQPSLLKCLVRSFEPPLRVALNLLRVGVCGEGEGVEGIVDAGGVYGRFLARCV